MRIKLSIQKRCLFVLPVALAISLSFSANMSSAQGSEDVALRQWIGKLADPVPAVRSRAEFEILAIGEGALPLLKDGLRDSNLEVHNRCRSLLEKLEARRKARLSKAFLEAVEGDRVLEEFPAWSLFSEFVGDQSTVTRKLFLKMCDEIPLVFEDHDLKVEQTGQSLKQAARLVLVKAKHPSASVDVLLTAYLFLADRALKTKEPANEQLFNSVEVLEGVNFIANSENAPLVRQSKFRAIVDPAVGRWVMSKKDGQAIPDNAMFNLAYVTSNPLLIDELFRSYDMFDKAMKLNFIDIVARSAVGKNGSDFDRCIAWLEKALEDEEVVVNSRFQKRPAEKVEVTPKLLAESILAGLLNEDVENSGPIEFAKIFGIYPRSGKGFLIVESEKDRRLLSDKLRVRMQLSESVE